ncbi:MAG TPA: hypothetical protein VKZ44_05875 [Taishania sp.]|nr:hypothetical protein [Taishania sp.]
MLNLWLVIAIVLVVYVTYMGFNEGFKRWAFMYVFAGIAIVAYLFRRFMSKRVEAHMKFLEEKERNSQK